MKIPSKLKKKLTKTNLRIIGLIAFALVGTILIFRTLASVPNQSIEAESATLTGGATKVSDNAASDGEYVAFGGTVTPPIPPNPAITENPVANAIYVATSGNDGNAGSESAPKRTLGSALDNAAGRTVYVKSGTYDVCGQNIPSGSEASYTRIVGAPGNTTLPILRCPSGYNAGGPFYTFSQHYIELKNLEIDCNGTATSIFMFGSNADGYTDGSHHLKIIGNTIHSCSQSGIQTGRADNILVEANNIYDNAYNTFFSGFSSFWNLDWPGSNIEGNYRFIIRNNRIFNNVTRNEGFPSDGNCIIFDENNIYDYQGRSLVTNNICYNNYGPGLRINASKNIDVINNTFYQDTISVTASENPWQPIANAPYAEIDMFRRDSNWGSNHPGVDVDVENVLIQNNIIHVRPGRNVFCILHFSTSDFPTYNIKFVNNMVSGDPATYSDGCPDITQNIAGNTGNFYVPDSMLVNPEFTATGDFRLRAGSPAIDRGAAGGPSFDFNYVQRTGTNDIGAFNY